jgi:uncharacterized protein YbjT (DUF2867 family)
VPSVLLLGATGLVGSACLTQLLDDPAFARVVTLTRRATGASHARLDARLGDLEHPDAHADAFAVDAVICALGTTIRQAGSPERFRAVDYGMPLAAARLARARGARHYLLVSSIGADAGSRNFYLRVKGEVERDIAAVGFPSLSIVRPSLLLGGRREFRLGERIGQLLSFVPMGPYTAIQGRDVATALVRLAKEERPGVRIVTSSEMRAWARKRRT